MITRISIYRGKSKNKLGNKIYSNVFTEIPKYYFKDIITGSDNLSSAFSYLKDNSIVITDGTYHYHTNYKKCIGYKFNDSLISVVGTTTISDGCLVKRIIKNKNNRKMNISNSIKDYRKYFINNFKLRYEEAFKWVEDEYNLGIKGLKEGGPEWIECVNKYNYSAMSIHMIEDRDVFFKRNTTNGRIDTNLTNLRSELRQFIDIKDLRQIDIKNSQPIFLSLLLDSLLCGEMKFTKEKKSFMDKCFRGDLYEYIFSFFYKKTQKQLTRKEIKNIIFAIFYSKPGSYQKEKNIFKDIFPEILNWIEKRKGNNHEKFAIELQKMESSMCIDMILPLLHLNGISCFTVHDSWIVKQDDLDNALNIIKNSFMDKYGMIPSFSQEKLT